VIKLVKYLHDNDEKIDALVAKMKEIHTKKEYKHKVRAFYPEHVCWVWHEAREVKVLSPDFRRAEG
jgi:hypothetical protein